MEATWGNMKLSNSLYRHEDIAELFDGNVKNGSLNYDVEFTGLDSQKREGLVIFSKLSKVFVIGS